MAATVANGVPSGLGRRTDLPLRMAKAGVREVRKADPVAEEARLKLGAAVHRARCRAELNLQEFAREMKRNERLIARWETGEKRPAMDDLLAHPLLKSHLIVALAELFSSDSIDVETVVRIRRQV